MCAVAGLHHCSHFADRGAGSSTEHKLRLAKNGDDMESGKRTAAG